MARELLQVSLSIAEEIGDVEMKTESLVGLGAIASALEGHEETRDFFQDSIALADKAGNFGLWADSLIELGHALFGPGQEQQARA